jgi:hypothetical protein
MSKFQELCNSYAEDQEAWRAYETECLGVLLAVVEQIRTDWGFPKDYVSFMPTDKEPEPNRNYGPAGACHFDADGFFCLGVAITLEMAPNVSPKKKLLIPICVRKADGSYLLRAGKQGEVIPAPSKDAADLAPFLDHFFAEVQGGLARLKGYLKKK